MKNSPIYTVIFEDNTKYLGGENYYNIGWFNVPQKKIKQILYRFPNNNVIQLEGYDNYYQYVEVIKILTGKERGKISPEYAYLIGKKNNEVIRYRISLKDKNEKIKIERFNIADREISKLNFKGWK